MKLFIDAHLDLAWNALSYNRDQTESVDQINGREEGMRDFAGRGRATTSLPELRRAGVAVCLATVLARSNRQVQPLAGHRRIDLDFGSPTIAYAAAQGQLGYYRQLERQGEMKRIRTSSDLEAHWKAWESAADADLPRLPVGNILAMEGADPIVQPADLESWWEDGLRSVMLAHYGPSQYAVGTGERGGLSAKGTELLKEFTRLGMILDMTHLSEESFFEASDRFAGPVMASHSNCQALVPGDRQLSDRQIKVLVERQAVIGVAFDAWMLQPGWVRGQSTPGGLTISAVADHVDHICQLAGNTMHVAIGSDLDGGFGTEQTPGDLTTITDLRQLMPILKDRGYSDTDLHRIAAGNWLRFFHRCLPD